MKALSPSEYRELRGLYESIYLPKIETILDEFTDEELDELTDEYIEEEVESFFLECLDEGLDITILEETICESIDASLEFLAEATVTTGQGSRMAARSRLARMKGTSVDNIKRAEALKRVKKSVKDVGRKVRGAVGVAARAAGTAVRAGSALKSAAKKGYERGRHGAGGPSSSSSGDDSSSSSSDSESSTSSSSSSGRSSTTPVRRRDGLLKRGLKKIVRGVGKTVSTGLGAAKAASDYVVSRAAKR